MHVPVKHKKEVDDEEKEEENVVFIEPHTYTTSVVSSLVVVVISVSLALFRSLYYGLIAIHTYKHMQYLFFVETHYRGVFRSCCRNGYPSYALQPLKFRKIYFS